MIGPNRAPTREVPWLWMPNSAIRIATVTGTTTDSSAGSATSNPSTADSTDMAGVIMPSP